VVAFFEKNGLQHGELALRQQDDDGGQNVVVVRELEWNCDSSVLAVWLHSNKERLAMGAPAFFCRDLAPPCQKYWSLLWICRWA
jgi:hypothetical protein